jgi:Rrf2 family protein
MKLSRTIEYALLATLELAQAEPHCPIPCSELARRRLLPERFLLQVLRCLVKHDVVCSVRGVDGGYYLARPPDKITLLDIVDAFDSPLGITSTEISGVSPNVHERLTESLARTTSAAREELQKVTLADFANE